MVFYYVHPAVLYINKFRVAGLLSEGIDQYIEQVRMGGGKDTCRACADTSTAHSMAFMQETAAWSVLPARQSTAQLVGGQTLVKHCVQMCIRAFWLLTRVFMFVLRCAVCSCLRPVSTRCVGTCCTSRLPRVDFLTAFEVLHIASNRMLVRHVSCSRYLLWMCTLLRKLPC